MLAKVLAAQREKAREKESTVSPVGRKPGRRSGHRVFLPSLALFTLMARVLYPYKNKVIKFTSQRPMRTLASH